MIIWMRSLRLRCTTLEDDIISQNDTVYIQDVIDNKDEILTTTLRSAQDDIIYIQDDIISQDDVFL